MRNESSRTQLVKKGFFWELFQNIIGNVFPFLIRGLFISKLGSELLGLNSLCVSVLSVLNAIDFGIDRALVQKLYKPIAENNIEYIGALLRYYRKLYRIIGIAILVLGLMVMPFFPMLISGELPEGINVRFVFGIYLFNVFLNYFFVGHETFLLLADQRGYIISRIVSLGYCVLYPIQLLTIVFGHYYLYLFIMPMITIVHGVLLCRYRKRHYSDFHYIGIIDKKEKKELIGDSISVGIYRFRDISRNTFDSVIISAFMGLHVLTKYQNYYSVVSVVILLQNVLTSAVTSSLGNYNVTNEKENTYSISRTIFLIQLFISGWAATCFLHLVQDFMDIWIGYEYRIADIIVLLMSVYIILLGICANMKMMRQSFGLWKRGRIVAGIEMITNLLLNIVFTKYMGLFGIIMATILTIALINIPYEARLIFKYYFSKEMREIIKMVMVIISWIIISNFILYIITELIPIVHFWTFAVKIVACGIIPPLLFVMMFYKTDDFRLFMSRIKL